MMTNTKMREVLKRLKGGDSIRGTNNGDVLEQMLKGRSVREVWDNAERGDLLLYLAVAAGADLTAATLAFCDYAEMYVDAYIPRTDKRFDKAIRVAREYAAGRASEEEVLEEVKNTTVAAREYESDFRVFRFGVVASQAAAMVTYTDAIGSRYGKADQMQYYAVWAARTGEDQTTAAPESTQAERLRVLADMIRDRISADDIEKALNG